MCSLDSRLCICLWRLLLGCENMKTAVSMQIKLAIIRLRNQNQSINQEHCKNPGHAQVYSLVHYEQEKKTGELNSVKRSGRLRKNTVVHYWRILSVVKKSPLALWGFSKRSPISAIKAASTHHKPLLTTPQTVLVVIRCLLTTGKYLELKYMKLWSDFPRGGGDLVLNVCINKSIVLSLLVEQDTIRLNPVNNQRIW